MSESESLNLTPKQGNETHAVEPLRSGQPRPTSVRMLEFVRNSESLVYNLHDEVIRVNSCILQGRRLVIDIDWAHLGQN